MDYPRHLLPFWPLALGLRPGPELRVPGWAPQISHIIREIRQFQQTAYKIEHQSKVRGYLAPTYHLLPITLPAIPRSSCSGPYTRRLGSHLTLAGYPVPPGPVFRDGRGESICVFPPHRAQASHLRLRPDMRPCT